MKKHLFIAFFICSSLLGMEQPERPDNEPLSGLPIDIKAEIVDYLISDPQFYDRETHWWNWREAAAQVRPLLCCCKKYYEQDEALFNKIVSKIVKKSGRSDYVRFEFSTAISKKYLKNLENSAFYDCCSLALQAGVPGTVTLLLDLVSPEKKEWFHKEGLLFAIANNLSQRKYGSFYPKEWM